MEKIKGENIFNSPIELGLRILFLFKNSKKNTLDLQRIIYYNYLLIHSSDIVNAPSSLHPEIPHRSCEILITRKILQAGINMLLSKGFISIEFHKTGILYKKNKTLNEFLSHFESVYARELDKRAKWVSDNFDSVSDIKLNKFMQENLGKWGSEFIRETNSLGEV